MKIQHDKKMHFYVGGVIHFGFYLIPQISVELAFVFVCAIALFKEMYDHLSQKGTPEYLDVISTLLGAAFSSLLILMFQS